MFVWLLIEASTNKLRSSSCVMFVSLDHSVIIFMCGAVKTVAAKP